MITLIVGHCCFSNIGMFSRNSVWLGQLSFYMGQSELLAFIPGWTNKFFIAVGPGMEILALADFEYIQCCSMKVHVYLWFWNRKSNYRAIIDSDCISWFLCAHILMYLGIIRSEISLSFLYNIQIHIMYINAIPNLSFHGQIHSSAAKPKEFSWLEKNSFSHSLFILLIECNVLSQ